MKKSKTMGRALAALLLMAPGAGLSAQDAVDLEDEDQRISYAIGANIGENLVSQQIVEDIDLEAFTAGMMDAITGEPKLEQAEIMAALQSYMQRQADEAQAELDENLAASEAFLAENAPRDGVVVLESGLQYEIMESGSPGGVSPTTSDSVLAHYHGTLADGSVFDKLGRAGEPATFGVSQVIAGWTEALQLMKIGDKWRLYIHPDMAYGESSPTPAIPPNSALIFEVELLEIR